MTSLRSFLSLLGMTLATATTAFAATPSVTSDVTGHSIQVQPRSVKVTAADMVDKVYGVVDPSCCFEQAMKVAHDWLCMSPVADEYGVWLDAADGYSVEYYGMRPTVTAMAHYDAEGNLSDYSYFFFFPYNCDCQDADDDQVNFCGVLLQELHDMGADMAQTVNDDAMFDVCGRYEDKLVQVRLVDEGALADNNDNRYVVSMMIEPGAFTPADDAPALATGESFYDNELASLD
ncbi:MAG: hypothetical protein K2H47_03025 [Muribaculaceae bacterium]|nr:hypothetical protein [Muribaculaceae bacterium]